MQFPLLSCELFYFFQRFCKLLFLIHNSLSCFVFVSGRPALLPLPPKHQPHRAVQLQGSSPVPFSGLMGRSYVFVGIQMVLAIFIITEAFGAETEFQRGIILFRPAADGAFMLVIPAADWVCF